MSCPGCGAPSVNASPVCAYCGRWREIMPTPGPFQAGPLLAFQKKAPSLRSFLLERPFRTVSEYRALYRTEYPDGWA